MVNLGTRKVPPFEGLTKVSFGLPFDRSAREPEDRVPAYKKNFRLRHAARKREEDGSSASMSEEEPLKVCKGRTLVSQAAHSRQASVNVAVVGVFPPPCLSRFLLAGVRAVGVLM